MNHSMNSMQSPAGIRSELAELQSLLTKSRSQQVHDAVGGDHSRHQQIPWQHANMMRWDQRIPPYQQVVEHDFNRGSIPSNFSNNTHNNGAGVDGPMRRLSNFSSVGSKGSASSPYGNGLRVKSITSESLSRMNISAPSLGLKKLSRNGSTGGGGFPMPRLGGMGGGGSSKKNKRPELVDLALSVAEHSNSRNSAMQQQQQQMMIRLLKKRHGCFPMPKLRPVKKSSSNNKKPYSLAYYKVLWVPSQDGEVSREVFARRLHRGVLPSV